MMPRRKVHYWATANRTRPVNERNRRANVGVAVGFPRLIDRSRWVWERPEYRQACYASDVDRYRKANGDDPLPNVHIVDVCCDPGGLDTDLIAAVERGEK